ncbi:MAG: hypothetical protein GY772_19900 [bacterium]|nr:hypothetical protein [bacterium]
MANLSLHLLTLYAKGELSGTQVQGIAAAAWKDGWGRHGPELARRLAMAGFAARWPSNIPRDIVRAGELAGLTSSAAQAYTVELPDGGSTEVFLPHEVYARTVLESGSTSQWCMAGDALETTPLGALLRSWAAHPDVAFAGDLTTVAALGFHCDAVQYTSNLRAGGARSVLVGSFNVISASGERRRNIRHPVFVLRKARLCECGRQGFHTVQVLCGIIAWSARCMLDGRAPHEGPDGAPWTPAQLEQRMTPGQELPRGALLQIRGDWEWLAQCCRLRSYSSNRFCWMCNATREEGALHFGNFDPAAPHRATLISGAHRGRACAQLPLPACGPGSALWAPEGLSSLPLGHEHSGTRKCPLARAEVTSSTSRRALLSPRSHRTCSAALACCWTTSLWTVCMLGTSAASRTRSAPCCGWR